MARIGPIWGSDIRTHSALVKEAYAPLLRDAPKAGIDVHRDLPYGSHPRQVVDVFSPAGPTWDARPVAVFVHGGAFIRGDKNGPEGLYDNVLYWFARQGFVGVNVEYRLAPESVHPGGADDVAAAIRWAHGNVHRFGGDPDRLLLIGHSAGGTHVASFAFDPGLPHRGAHAAAIVLISARLRADTLPENPNAAGVAAYFGTDPAAYGPCSPVAHGDGSGLPTMIVIAEHENPLLDLYGLEMAHAIAVARRRAPRILTMPGHNHLSIVAHFNTAEERLGRAIIDFLESAAPRPAPVTA